MIEREQLLKGSLFMAIGFFFTAISASFIKAANTNASSLWVVLISSATALVIQFFFNLNKGFKFLKTQRPWGHFARVFFGVFSSLLFAYSLKHISLLNATLLFNTAPLFVPIFAIFILKNKVPLKIWFSLLFGFIGVVIILQPDASIIQKPGNLIGLASGIFQGLTFIFVKMLTQTEPVQRINFYFFLGSTILLAPLAYFLADLPPMESVLWSMCSGVIAFIAQYFIVNAYQYADASHIGAFQYTSVVFAGLIGWVVWDQTPNLLDILGILFVVLGGILAITLYHMKTQNAKR